MDEHEVVGGGLPTGTHQPDGAAPTTAGEVPRGLAALAANCGDRPETLAAAYASRLSGFTDRAALAADLEALVAMAEQRHPAAWVLVGAMLAAAPPGHRLLAGVRRFREPLAGASPPGHAGAPASATASDLRRLCDGILARIVKGDEPGPEQRAILRDTMMQQVRARAARIARLVGRQVAVDAVGGRRRLLRLAGMEASLADIEALLEDLGGRGGREALLLPRRRFLAALDEGTRGRIDAVVSLSPRLQRFEPVWRGVADAAARPADALAAWRRLRAVLALAAGHEMLPGEPDPLRLAAMMFAGADGGCVRIPLPRAFVERRSGTQAPGLPEGVRLEDGVLEIDAADNLAAAPARSLAPPVATEADEPESQDADRSALKRLVLTNLSSTSVTIAFLRDAKVTSIPGLVEEIVVRTRNPQILEIIATTRTLHSGFANRGVPLALLRSQVNVSVKLLRRFVHVKYISKLELRRLAADRTGIRREVGQEIEAYLSSLA